MASTVFQVVGRFRADTKQFANGLAAASNSMQTFNTRAQAVAAKSQRVGASMTRFMTVPLLAVGGAAAAASIEFESAFVGVRKTVDATEIEFERLEKSIRDMSKELPVSASELARIGEIAGQLGIEAQGLDKFIKTVADLGQTTTLNVEEGAFALARISNVMGVATSDSERLGSTIVDLGNNFAATENEITTMSERIVGAAKVADISTSDVLAFGAALSAVGLRAEAGGSSISRLFIQMQGAVREGGQELARYADVANTTASDFAQTWSDRPIEAILQFIEGLESMRKAGGDVFSTLEDLQLSEIRVRDTLLRAAGAGDLVRKAVNLGNEAWEENIALQEEANKRYASTESQLRMVWNQVVDAARAFGDVLAPALLDTAQAISPVIIGFFEFLEGIHRMNPALRTTIITMAALAVGIGPVTFMVGKAIQLFIGLKGALSTMTSVALAAAVKIEALAVAMGTSFTVALGAVGIAIAAAAVAITGIVVLINRLDTSADSAAESAGTLAESVGMQKRELEKWNKVVQDGEDSLIAFQAANQDTIKRLKEMNELDAQSFLLEIGVNLVASGAGSPEEVFEHIQRLADAANIDIPMSVTADDLSLENLEQTMAGAAQRISGMMAERFKTNFAPANIGMNQVKEEINATAETLAQAMQSGDEGFQQAIMGAQAFIAELKETNLTTREVSDATNFFVDELAKLGRFSDLSTMQMSSLEDMIRQLGESGNITSTQMADLLFDIGAMDAAGARYTAQARAMGGATRAAGDAMDDTKSDAVEFTEEIEAATQAVDEQIRALRALADPFFAYMDAENKLEQAIASRQEILNTSNEDMGGAAQKAAALAASEQEVFEALIDVSAEHARAKSTIEQTEGAEDKLIGTLTRAAEQWGVNLDEIDLNTGSIRDLAAEILGMPKNVEIRTHTPGLTHVFNELGELQRIIGEINGSSVNIQIGTGASGSVQHSGGFAGSGPMRKMANLRHDEVPAILQKGEFVLSRMMVRQLSQMMRFHDGGYVVQKGDTLSGIASKVMGDAGAWRELFEANKGKIKDPNLIFPGQNLVVPHSHGSNSGGGSSGSGGMAGVFPSGMDLGKISSILSSGPRDADQMQRNVDKVREMVEGMERFQQEFDRAAQRKDLVQNIKDIRSELAGADKEEAEGLRQRLEDSKKQLESFDRQTKRINAELEIQKKIEAQLAAIERQRAKEALQLEMRNNKQQIQFDNMTREQQIRNLTKRMGAHQKYTDEWTQLYNQRKSLMEQERQEAEALQKVFSDLAENIGGKYARALRRFADSDDEFQQLAQRATQFQQSWKSAIDGFAGLVSNFANKEFVRFESVVKRMADRVQQVAEFQQNLVELGNRGLDDTIIAQLAAAGPQAAALVDALLNGDIGVINALQSQLEALGTEGAGEIFSSMLGTDTILPPKVDFTVIMDGEQIARVVGQYLAEEITVHTGVS